MTTPLAVETMGLSRRYGRRWALSDVSLGVETGAVVMLAGRNGSGIGGFRSESHALVTGHTVARNPGLASVLESSYNRASLLHLFPKAIA